VLGRIEADPDAGTDPPLGGDRARLRANCVHDGHLNEYILADVAKARSATSDGWRPKTDGILDNP